MTNTKIQELLVDFTNLESIEIKVPMVCLVTGCVSRRRDGRYFSLVKLVCNYQLSPRDNLKSLKPIAHSILLRVISKDTTTSALSILY